MRQETFDYVIIGSGSAGSVLANRLTEDGRHTVLVLEAGPTNRMFRIETMFMRMPAGSIRIIANPNVNWCFATEPNPNTKNRAIHYPRGRVLGGTSMVNGSIYVRGQAADFDTWAQRGNRGWSYADVLPYFRKSENWQDEPNDFRGKGGPLSVTVTDVRDPVTEAWIGGCRELGVPANPDYNGARQEGVAYHQRNIRRGRRHNAGQAFLRPAMKRSNLAVQTEAHVQRILFEGKAAVGVAYRHHGSPCEARARKEVILSAGAIGSPHLLQLSGVGPGPLLQRLGVPVVHELPGVGENLSDHMTTRQTARIKPEFSLNRKTRGWRLGVEIAKWFLAGRGVLALSAGQCCAFVRSSPDLEEADLQFAFAPASYAAQMNGLAQDPGMSMGMWQMRPESRGYVRASSPVPEVQPLIQPNFLDTAYDREVVVRGLKFGRRVFQSKAMAPYFMGEDLPGPQVQSDDEWLDYARQYGHTVYHPISTCRMGPDPMSVVDEQLRVRGIDRLRVIDASIMPTPTSGNTNAPTIMIAEKGADMVRSEAS